MDEANLVRYARSEIQASTSRLRGIGDADCGRGELVEMRNYARASVQVSSIHHAVREVKEQSSLAINNLRSSVLPRIRKFAAILFIMHDMSADAFGAALNARLPQP